MLVAYNPLSAQNSYNVDGTLNKHVNKYKKYWQHQSYNIYDLINKFNIRVHTIHITRNEENNRWYLCSGKAILNLAPNMNAKIYDINNKLDQNGMSIYEMDYENFNTLGDINEHIIKDYKLNKSFTAYNHEKFYYKNEKICSFKTVGDLIFYLNYIFNFEHRKIIDKKTNKFDYYYKIRKNCSFIIVLENSKYIEEYIKDVENIFTCSSSNSSLILGDNILDNVIDTIDEFIYQIGFSNNNNKSLRQIYEYSKNEKDKEYLYNCLKFCRMYILQVYYNIDYFGVRYNNTIKILSKYENKYDGVNKNIKRKNKVKYEYDIYNLNFVYYNKNQYNWNDNLTFDENIKQFTLYKKQNKLKLPKYQKLLSNKINLTDELFMHPSNYYLLDWIGLGKEKKKIYNYKYFGTSLYKFFGYNDNVSITKEINNNVYFKHNELPKIQKSLIYKENNLFVNDYLYKKISISNYFIKNLVQKINIFFNSFSK